MSGAPTQVEIETMLQHAVDIFWSTVDFADGTLASAGGKYDDLLQSLEGEYTTSLSRVTEDHRALVSNLADPNIARAFLEPIFREYAAQVLTDGAGRRDLGNTRAPGTIMRAVYELFADALNDGATPRTVESRAISFDSATSAYTSDGGNSGLIVGTGTLSRLTVDEWGYAIEDATPETKYVRCVADQNSGAKENAELFQVLGDPRSRDNLLRTSTRQSGAGEVYGSGALADLRARHAGEDTTGGSLLKNSSFSDFTAGTPNTIRGWTIVSGESGLTQNTTEFFRSFPNANTDASLQATAAFKLTQSLAQMTPDRLDPLSPYFLRVMYNAQDGSATGDLNLKLGGLTAATVTVTGQTGWNELTYTLDENLYFRNFNEDGFDIEVEWTSAGGTHLLIDDAIFAPFTVIDQTYWMMRGGATPFKLNDTFKREDTGGAPATAKIQYAIQLAGLGYLPHTTGVPTITEP